MKDYRLECVKCFLEQEQFIPLQEYKHKIHLIMPYGTFFVVLFTKVNHPDELLALKLPYLSTCQQMKLLYYDLVEPSAHDVTLDGKIFWAGVRENEIPSWADETQKRVEKILEDGKQPWLPGPAGGWEEIISDPVFC